MERERCVHRREKRSIYKEKNGKKRHDFSF